MIKLGLCSVNSDLFWTSLAQKVDIWTFSANTNHSGSIDLHPLGFRDDTSLYTMTIKKSRPIGEICNNKNIYYSKSIIEQKVYKNHLIRKGTKTRHVMYMGEL